MRKRTGFSLIELLVVVAVIAVLVAILSPSLRRVVTLTRRMMCGANLRQYVIAMGSYLKNNDGIFPSCHSGGPVTVETTWIGALHPYAGGVENLGRCPELHTPRIDYGVTWEWSFTGHHLGYGYNMWFLGGSHEPGRQNTYADTRIPMVRDTRASSVRDASTCMIFADSNPKTAGGADYGCTISLFWPLVNRYHEGVNGTRHDNAAAIVFVDGHAEIFRDPDNTINPPYDDSPFFLQYWDHLKRKSLWD